MSDMTIRLFGTDAGEADRLRRGRSGRSEPPPGRSVSGLATCLVLATALALPAAAPAQFEDVGSLTFPTSSQTKKAQHHFLRGVAILHGFGWKQAIAEFQAAQEVEPDFAMAYWGEALCYNHPLLGERDLESPREVLARLGATPRERLAKAPTEREKGFLGAIEALFGEGSRAERKIAYMEAMKSLYEGHPDDDEVAAFYALSMLMATGPLGDRELRHPVRAGAIALDIFRRNPNHPGAAHYTIHAFDDPVHAPLALEAAYRFAEIAPAVAHARHMPSHIFIQHGMWDRVAQSNISAYQAAIDLWEPGDSVGDAVHSLDWGQYGHLQRGDYAMARDWIGLLEKLVERSDGASRAVSTVPLMQARYMVETGDWGRYPIDEPKSAVAWFGHGMNALEAGDVEGAQEAVEEIRREVEEIEEDSSTFARSRKPGQIMAHELQALVLLARDEPGKALDELAAGVAIAGEMDPPRGSANPIKPVHELFGEVLLARGEAESAIGHFDATLESMPDRPLSLLGLARAHSKLGNGTRARDAYGRLMHVWSDNEDLQGFREARDFVSSASAETPFEVSRSTGEIDVMGSKFRPVSLAYRKKAGYGLSTRLRLSYNDVALGVSFESEDTELSNTEENDGAELDGEDVAIVDVWSPSGRHLRIWATPIETKTVRWIGEDGSPSDDIVQGGESVTVASRVIGEGFFGTPGEPDQQNIEGWSLMITVPFAVLGEAPGAGDEWRANFTRWDFDAGDGAMWSWREDSGSLAFQ